jgi:hypothetical protein
MSVAAIKYVNIIGFEKNIEQVAKICVDAKCFHPDDINEFYKKAHG